MKKNYKNLKKENMIHISKVRDYLGKDVHYFMENILEVRKITIVPHVGIVAESSYGGYMPLNPETKKDHKYQVYKIDGVDYDLLKDEYQKEAVV